MFIAQAWRLDYFSPFASILVRYALVRLFAIALKGGRAIGVMRDIINFY